VTTLPPTYFFPLPLHDALPILLSGSHSWFLPHRPASRNAVPSTLLLVPHLLFHTTRHQVRPMKFLTSTPLLTGFPFGQYRIVFRSEEHTSELQSRENLVCRLLR